MHMNNKAALILTEERHVNLHDMQDVLIGRRSFLRKESVRISSLKGKKV